MNFLDLIWLIPLVPLMGAAVMLFFGRRLPKAAISLISPGAVGVSFLLSLGAVIQLAGLPHRRIVRMGPRRTVLQRLGVPGAGMGPPGVRWIAEIEGWLRAPRATL